MHLQENSIFDLWPDRGQGHTKCCPVPSTSCDLSATKFEIATSNRLGGDTFTRKYIFWPLTLTVGSRSHKISPEPSTSCDLFTYKVWSFLPLTLQEEIPLQETWRTDGRTHRRTGGQMMDRLWHEINIPFFLKKTAGITRLHRIIIIWTATWENLSSVVCK